VAKVLTSHSEIRYCDSNFRTRKIFCQYNRTFLKVPKTFNFKFYAKEITFKTRLHNLHQAVLLSMFISAHLHNAIKILLTGVSASSYWNLWLQLQSLLLKRSENRRQSYEILSVRVLIDLVRAYVKLWQIKLNKRKPKFQESLKSRRETRNSEKWAIIN
jgi:hypothetical protein